MTPFKISNYYEERKIKIPNRKNWVLIDKEYKFKLNLRLKFHLDILVKDLNSNDDALIILFGPEGAGKTVLESQIAYYLGLKTKQKVTVDNYHFDGQSYIDFSLNSPKLTINCLDESRRALNKMRASSSSNVDFMNFLSECRSQNQIHIVLLPAYTDLEQYVAIHRPKMIISVEKKRNPETMELIRGVFALWTTKYKWLLKKAWDGKYKEPPREMLVCKGRFDNVLCLNEQEYDKKKEDAKKERYESKEVKNNNMQKSLSPSQERIYEYLMQGANDKQIAQELNFTDGYISKVKKTIIEKGFNDF